MNKNTLLIGGVVILIVIIGVVTMGSPKKSKTVNTNSTVTNIGATPLYAASLTITDNSVTPPDFTVGLSQTIKIELINQGTTAHSFTFSQLDFNSGPIDPDTTRVVTFTTPSTAGRYEYFSDQGDDRVKGISGTMLVQ